MSQQEMLFHKTERGKVYMKQNSVMVLQSYAKPQKGEETRRNKKNRKQNRFPRVSPKVWIS